MSDCRTTQVTRPDPTQIDIKEMLKCADRLAADEDYAAVFRLIDEIYLRFDSLQQEQ